MPKKTAPPAPPVPSLPDFDPGDAVILTRPHLYSNCAGVIVSVKNGVHLVKIHGRNGHDYHTEAQARDLRFNLGADL